MAATSPITKIIYDEYYQRDITPQALISSYWKDMHKNSKVRLQGDDLYLKGVGFGDMQQASLPYLFFSWLTIFAHLCHMRDRWAVISKMFKAIQLAHRMGLPFTYDSFRQVCSLVLIMKNYQVKLDQPLRIISIGDGFGFLSCLIKQIYPNSKMYLVDLGKTLLFQSHFAFRAFSSCKHRLINAQSQENEQEGDFNFCPAELISKIEGKNFDIAINIESMQEMNEATVKCYFDFLRQNLNDRNLFYCCNREEKIMAGGEVSRIADYPWSDQDRFLLDELCPWCSFYLSHHKTLKGLTIFNCRIPFINFMDGPTRHRVSILRTISQ